MGQISEKNSYFCGMNELAQHIETLLLENDCVIVPGLGGFVAHHVPAMRVAEENLFLPPTRTIGFNPQLKMNDGLLVQSYMSVYNTSFSDATRMVERTVSELNRRLHEEGMVELSNIGELRYSLHGKYNFLPYENKFSTPCLYGLDSFEMKELAALSKTVKSEPRMRPVRTTTDTTPRTIRMHRFHWEHVAAMVAVIALFFCFSAPIENTEVLHTNHAQLLPEELFGQVGKQSLALHPITREQKKEVKPVAVREVKVSASVPAVTATPAAVKSEAKPATVVATPKVETPAATPAPVVKRPYHIIVASVGTQKDAEAMAEQLIAKGYKGAKAIICDGKKRVSIESCASYGEASKTLEVVRQEAAYQGAWILKR